MWNNPLEDYLELAIENHRTANELLEIEKQKMNGVTL